MEDSQKYGQMDFNLPHDVVSLPSGGLFYNSKKKTVKLGYLTASDENLLANINERKTIKETIVLPLLRSKLYEPDLRPEELLDGDIEALLIFLRNTSFGPEYNLILTDPKTDKDFETVIFLDQLDVRKTTAQPDKDGHFVVTLPKTQSVVKYKLLSLKDSLEVDSILQSYPKNVVAPTATLKLSKQIVEIDGTDDRVSIEKFVQNMPIMDSKFLKKFMYDNEPRLDLLREVIAPSGEKVVVNITFGVEFFRPFF